MYVPKYRSPLTGFYAVASESQLQIDRASIRYLNCILEKCGSEFRLPSDSGVDTVDRYVNKHLSESSIDLVVSKLYQAFLTESSIAPDISHRIWVNFIHCINSSKLVPKLWNQLPVYKRTNEKLELFQNSALLSPLKLFANFNPAYDREFLKGVERWTYVSLRNISYAQIRRRGEPLFGLTDLGVVAKLTLTYLRNTRSRYVSKQQLESDTLLVHTFKNYLKRSGVRTNRLQPTNWEEIQREIERQWHKLGLDAPPPNIDKIRQDLDAIGDCVRQAIEMQPIDSLDRVLNSNNSEQTLAETISDKNNLDLEDRESLLQGCDRLIPVIQTAIDKLDAIDSAILRMHYHEGLTQQEIGEKLGEDQPSISKKIRLIHQQLLKAIHQQIDNPNHSPSRIDRTSIAAMKQLLKIFYQN